MTLLRAAFSDPAYRRTVFFEPARFSVEASVRAWGTRMLNADAAIRTWEDVMASLPTHSVFVRPNDDDKAFTGAVFSPGELRALYGQLTARNLAQPSDLVAISQSREVDAEARIFIVEGKVIGGSYYRPDASPRLPADLIDFAQEAARVWSPAPVFVLDVGRVSGAYRIIETNCMNGCRFYGADVLAVVEAISRYQAAHWRDTPAS